MTQRLEPLTDEELGEYRDKLGGRKVYGIIRRKDIDEEVLASMRISPEARELRLRKSRRWMLPQGFPQLGHTWEAIIDFGPFKSEWNGKHDLPGGTKCFICHTWCRYGHVLLHSEWDVEIIVGCDCAAMLGDTDPTWTEKKLQAIVDERQQRLLQEEQERLGQEEERLRAEQTAAEMLRLHALPESSQPIESHNDWLQKWRDWVEWIQDVATCNLYHHIGNKWFYSQNGNPTFKTTFYGIPLSGTVYLKNRKWRYILNLPETIVHSSVDYDDEDTAFEAARNHCVIVFCELVESPHTQQHYAPVDCRKAG